MGLVAGLKIGAVAAIGGSVAGEQNSFYILPSALCLGLTTLRLNFYFKFNALAERL